MQIKVRREREAWGRGQWYSELERDGEVSYTSDWYLSKREAYVDAMAEMFLRKK